MKAEPSPRLACLLVPDLPLHAELRANPDLAFAELVITTGPGTRAEILCASIPALQQGIQPGSTLPQARALCRDLVARVASPALEQTARETLLDIALSLAPQAELATRAGGFFAMEGAVFVDASGIDALHGSESAFASVLHARAEAAFLPGFVTISRSRNIALLAARHLALEAFRQRMFEEQKRAASSAKTDSPKTDWQTIQILASGQERTFIGPLSVDLLDPSDAISETLTRFGVRNIHDLLRLPRRDLAARLGPEVLDLIARALGEKVEPPLAAPQNHTLEEGLDLESSIVSLEPLAFVLRGLVSRILERLRLRSLGCLQLDLEMRLESGARENRRIGLAEATQDERVLLRLLRLALESEPPRNALEGLRLRCQGIPLRREQLDFFLPRGPSPSELDQTLAELRALCGADRVGAPALSDDHRPDSFQLKPFRPAAALSEAAALPGAAAPRPRAAALRPRTAAHPPPRRTHGLERPLQRPPQRSTPPKSPPRGPRMALRAFRPPIRAQVQTSRGRPTFLRSRIARGEILISSGPFRTTGGWWSEVTHFAVDHYDIQMSDGSVLRLCFDWKTKWWRIDGLYD